MADPYWAPDVAYTREAGIESRAELDINEIQTRTRPKERPSFSGSSTDDGLSGR